MPWVEWEAQQHPGPLFEIQAQTEEIVTKAVTSHTEVVTSEDDLAPRSGSTPPLSGKTRRRTPVWAKGTCP
jgi:hypothetical protein